MLALKAKVTLHVSFIPFVNIEKDFGKYDTEVFRAISSAWRPVVTLVCKYIDVDSVRNINGL